MRRLLPALGLFFLAPLIAEFLLGNLPITMLGSLVVLAPLYGGGALLIREVVRRTGRGWASIVVLALAYGILEEAFLTQTLFNPNYLGLNLRLLDSAYLPGLGMGVWWTVFVLTLHTVWSISASIGLAEALVPERATRPWLGTFGFTAVGLVFVLAAAAVCAFSIKQDHSHFVATRNQFVSSGVIFLAVAATALCLPRRSRLPVPGSVPNPWLISLIALMAASIFLVIPSKWGWSAVVAYAALDAMMIVAVCIWSRRTGWDGRHRLGLAGGATLAYTWHAFVASPAVGQAGTVNRIGNGVFAIGAVILLAVAARRTGLMRMLVAQPPPERSS